MRSTLIALSFLILAGCATDPTPLSETSPVPADRISDSTYTKPAVGTHPITVVRDYGWGRGALPIGLWVDGVKTATLDQKEAITLYLPDGEHLLTAGAAARRALAAGDSSLSVQIPSRYRVYRIDLDTEIKLQPSVFN